MLEPRLRSESISLSGRRKYLPGLSSFIRPIKDNYLNGIGHAVGQDSETKSTEHCPKYKQSTVI